MNKLLVFFCIFQVYTDFNYNKLIMKKLFGLIGILLFNFSISAQVVVGEWYGTLDVGISKLHLILHIQQDDSVYSATLDSPDQNANGILVPGIQFDNDTLQLDLSNIGAKYIGELDPKSNTIKGDFTQRGQTLPLQLSRNKPELPKRPQIPKKPYPYQSEDVYFNNEEQDLTLAGTLTLPEEGENFPAVILISGSGPQDRNEELLGHKPFLVISDYLTRKGIAVLRYDDRGVRDSKGTFVGSTTADFATDANAAFQYLKNRKEIDSTKIGLMGHSEGGLIAPMVASQHKDVAFVILLAGPGVDLGKVLIKQEELIGKTSGVSNDIIEANREVNTKVFDLIHQVKDSVELRQEIKMLYENAIRENPELNLKANQGVSNKRYIKMVLAKVMDPWMRYAIVYNPAPTLEKVKCPVLALNGTNDTQVDAKQNLPEIRRALKEGGNTDVTTKKIVGLNHLFQESKTGAPAEYKNIEQTFSPKALKVITDWISQKTK